MKTTVERQLAGRRLILETGQMAKQANGSVVVRYADTMVLAAAVMDTSVREGIDFFPLTVDYREKYYASGKIPGGFFKREARPTDKETLTCRLIDRPMRPLFPKGFSNETQIMVSVLSADEHNNPDIVGMIGAFAALAISDIPFDGLLGAVRIGMIGSEYIINPTYEELVESRLNLTMAGTKDAVMMVESEAGIISEDEMIGALEAGHKAIAEIADAVSELVAAAGKKKMEVTVPETNSDLASRLESAVKSDLRETILVKGKEERSEALKALFEKGTADLLPPEDDPEYETVKKDLKEIYHDLEAKEMRRLVLEEGIRADGRGTTEVRPITIETSLIPRAHGSALFTRGETQSLGTTTLGTSSDEQVIDNLLPEYKKHYYLHYNFPPFCTGEVKFLRGTGRREIGHGMLAERALLPILPDKSAFPYTIRVVSDILESNGSSSMASVCSGCLSMMDAGVPIKEPVAGIAMGLIMEGEKFAILSDILGLEDHLGDMDFKVTGTREGITALQMDIKISGVSTGSDGRSARTGTSGTPSYSREDGGRTGRTTSGTESTRPPDRNDNHRHRTHPGCHRPGRKDDPKHHRRNRCQDGCGGRWDGCHRQPRRRVACACSRDGRSPHGGCRNRQDLHGQGGPPDELRGFCRSPPRQRGPRAYFPARFAPRGTCGRRCQHRRHHQREGGRGR